MVSPEAFHDEDLVLCAITSRLPERFSEWGVSLEAPDMVEGRLPKKSVVKLGKLFTMHCDLIARRFGTVKERKLQEILDQLRALFSRPAAATDASSEEQNARSDLRTEEVDEAVLALLHLNAFEDRGAVRSWKTFDWDAMDRLHERGLIGDPKSKAKSVPLTADGVAAAQESFRKRLARW